MGFLKKFSDYLSSSGSEKGTNALWVVVKCSRCGEIIRTRVDLRNDLSIDYSAQSGAAQYFCRKTLIGESRCFQRVDVSLTFDKDRHLVDRSITGGDFVDEK